MHYQKMSVAMPRDSFPINMITAMMLALNKAFKHEYIGAQDVCVF